MKQRSSLEKHGLRDDAESETRLLEDLRAGDPNAFELMVRRYGPRLLAVARRIVRNEEDAKDCLQDTFLAAHRSIGNFEGRSRLGTWLHRIAINTALMRLRKRGSRPEELIDHLMPAYDRYALRVGPRTANDLTPEELLLQTNTRELVRKAIDRLPENYRTVLLLRDIEGYDTNETAELLETTAGAVKTRLHRARTALKELLQPLFAEDLR